MAAGPVPDCREAKPTEPNTQLRKAWRAFSGALNKWFREWALIDLLAFGGGTVSTICYALYRQDHPQEKTWAVELWPEVSLTLLGAWLSVRVIDAIIQRRDKRHNVRGALVSNLHYAMGIGQKLVPKFYDFDIKSLENELSFFELRLPRRQRYLSRRDLSLLNEWHIRLERIISMAHGYADLRQRIGQADATISYAFDKSKQPGSQTVYLSDMKEYYAVQRQYWNFTDNSESAAATLSNAI